MKITDFGSSRQLSKDNNETLPFERSETGEYSTVFKPFGTHGWNGPEYVDGTKHYSYWIDIFPLGCIFGFILTKGGHPFSDKKVKEWDSSNKEATHVVNRINDKQQKMLFKGGDIPNEEDKEMIELIDTMLNKSNPENRPTSADILKQSYFKSFNKDLPSVTGYVTHFKSRLIYISMK